MEEDKLATERANALVHQGLDARLSELEQITGGDVLVYLGPIHYGADDEIRDAVESRGHGAINGAPKGPRLSVVLETPGGYAEVAERIADTLRAHYRRVDFIIPNHAFSAGTLLVMSGDAIYMDYYSVLSPIDPQVKRNDRWIPVLGYLEQYKALVNKSERGELTTAELAFLLDKFDPGELHAFEQQMELSVTLLKKWLVNYKFKNWRRTRTRKVPVTLKLREKRAEEIARKLQKTTQWHVHSRGLSKDVLVREVKLRIDDFSKNRLLNTCMRRYYRLLKDYQQTAGINAALHVPRRFTPLALM